MRHGIAGNRLNRKSSHRKATVRDIAKAALIHERISTTKIKAKEARKLVDQLITMGKKGTLAEKRRAFAVLCDHQLVSELFNKIAPRFNERQGGYTRIIPVGNRKGDNAEMAYLELTEKTEVILSNAKGKASAKSVTTEEKPKKEKAKAKKVQAKEDSEEKAPAKAEAQTLESTEKTHSKKDVVEPTKGKIGNKISGIKKFFNKKPTGNK